MAVLPMPSDSTGLQFAHCNGAGRPLAGMCSPLSSVPGCVILPTTFSQRVSSGRDCLRGSFVVAAPPGASGGRTSKVKGARRLRCAALSPAGWSVRPFPAGRRPRAVQNGGERVGRGLGRPAGWEALRGGPGPAPAPIGGAPPSPQCWAATAARPEPRASAPLEPSGWRRHGVRGAAHCVPDPAARAPDPAPPHAGHRVRGTRALPGCEWGAGGGVGSPGPGGWQCLVASPQVLSLPVSRWVLSLLAPVSVSLTVFSLSLSVSLPPGLFGALPLSLSLWL